MEAERKAFIRGVDDKGTILEVSKVAQGGLGMPCPKQGRCCKKRVNCLHHRCFVAFCILSLESRLRFKFFANRLCGFVCDSEQSRVNLCVLPVHYPVVPSSLPPLPHPYNHGPIDYVRNTSRVSLAKAREGALDHCISNVAKECVTMQKHQLLKSILEYIVLNLFSRSSLLIPQHFPGECLCFER